MISIFLVSLGMTKPNAHAETSIAKFLPKYDAVIEDNTTNNTSIIERYWFYENILPLNGTSYEIESDHKAQTVFSDQIKNLHDNNYDLPIGLHNNFDYSLYIEYDLKNIIPKQEMWANQKIVSVKLRALVEGLNENETNDKTYLSVNTCDDNSWYHEDHNETSYLNDYRNLTDQSCFNSARPVDSLVASRNELPKIFEWDVTEGVKKEIELGHDTVTFVIYGIPFSEQNPVNSYNTHERGLVSFTSYSTADSPFSPVGVGAVPALLVTYETLPTIPDILGNSSNQISLLSMGIPAIAWFYREEIKKHVRNIHVLIKREGKGG